MITIVIIICGVTLCGVCLVVVLLFSRSREVALSDKAIDLSTVLPIQYIETDGFIVNGNGDITIGYQLLLPEVFTLTEEASESIHSRLLGLFKMLPPGTVIHQQNFFYTSKYENREFPSNVLIWENMNHFNGKEVINSYSNLYITFTSTDKLRHKKSATNTSLLRKYNYPFSQPFKDFSRLREEIEALILNFENGLSAIPQFEIKKFSDSELNNAVFDFINLSYDHPTRDATKETLSPISTIHGDMKIGNKFVAILSLTGEGEKIFTSSVPETGKRKSYGTDVEIPENIKSTCSMIYPLGLGLPFDHVTNTVIEITDADNVVTAIRSEKSSMNLLANFYQRAKEKQKEQEAFCNMVMENGYQTTCMAFNVIINETDKVALNRKIALVRQGFSLMNSASSYTENAETANLFFSSIPGNARANYRGFVNVTQQALCYLQKDNLYISSLKGHIFTDRFGKPVKIDLWNYPGLPNRNRIIIGPSGSGKSFLANNIILQSYEQGKDIIIIDIGGSYKELIGLNHGRYFDSTEKSNFAFNPFLCPQDKNGNYIYLDFSDEDFSDDLIKTIAAILSYIWKKDDPITQTEKVLLEKSIKEFYQYVNRVNMIRKKNKMIPSLIEYNKFLGIYQKQMDQREREKFDIWELGVLLEPYTKGELKYLLNSKKNIDVVNDRLIAFDMEDVSKKEYFPIIGIITLQLAIDKIKKRQGVEKELYIDEALDFLKDEKFGDFIGYLFRTYRKKEGSISIAAQNVLFLQHAPEIIRDSIIINCATKIILDHSENRENLNMVKNILSVSEAEVRMIESIQSSEDWREFFIKLGNDPYVFRNEVSEFSKVAFDSRQKTKVRIKELFRETGSTYTAINRYIQERDQRARKEGERDG